MTTGISTPTSKGRICVSVAQPTVEQALAAARPLVGLADVIEIRLDALATPAVAPFMEQLPIPLLFTNRPRWEGGTFTGDEETRTKPLIAAAAAGCAYVDLELRAEAGLRRELQAAAGPQTALVLSWHNFELTPDDKELADILALQQEGGARIGKIVTMAHGWGDVLRVLHLQLTAAARNFPLIAFCMGAPGVISRLATLELGGYMTYAAPDLASATAPGQIPATTLKTMLAELRHGN